MKVATLLTADYATVEQPSGKLHILGAFTRIYAHSFPCTHRRMAIVVKLKPELGDHPNERELSVVLVDQDGIELMRFSGPFNLPHGEGGVRPEFCAVLEMNNLQFAQPGIYEFAVYADDQHLSSTSIEVLQIEG
jgi:hypothetical protein